MFGILKKKPHSSCVHTRQGSNYCYLHFVGGEFEVGITLLKEVGLLEMKFSWLSVSCNHSASKRKQYK